MLRDDALDIFNSSIAAANPYRNTRLALSGRDFNGRVLVFAIGKAAVPMAQAAIDELGDIIDEGLLVTKYDHTGTFRSDKFTIIEAAHPVSDENSVVAADTALKMVKGLSAEDTCIVLLSGGGSALFEKPIISKQKQRYLTQLLMYRGADIFELNAVRKRLSLVKGGGFAAHCAPAKVLTLALSDVADNKKEVICSGITVKDTVTEKYFTDVLKKYSFDTDEEIQNASQIKSSLPKVTNGEYVIIGDSDLLCNEAGRRAQELGYVPIFSGVLSGEADDAGRMIAALAKCTAEATRQKTALIFGGETTVTLHGNGKGGRNQQLALSAALMLEGTKGILLLSAGSDGTDGPTDAAGGFADGDTVKRLRAQGVSPQGELNNNNAYFALSKANDLIITGPTGTNVNDLVCVLIDSNEYSKNSSED